MCTVLQLLLCSSWATSECTCFGQYYSCLLAGSPRAQWKHYWLWSQD